MDGSPPLIDESEDTQITLPLLADHRINTNTAPGALQPATWSVWAKEHWFAPVLLVLTLVPYTAINAAFAADLDAASLAEKVTLAVFTCLASDITNLAFDVLTAAEMQADILKHWRNAYAVIAGILFYGISFHTAIAWAIAGERAINTFEDTLGAPATEAGQVSNDVYLFFNALMFTMAIFKLPGLVKDIFQQKDPLIKVLLSVLLLTGGALGLAAYFALTQALLAFPAQAAQQGNVSFFGRYLVEALNLWPGFAYVFPTTQGAFCVLNATRGLIELMKHGIGIIEGRPEERCLRAKLLGACLVVTTLSVLTSAYQATGPLRGGISACSVFVNLSALAQLVRVSYEKRGQLEVFEDVVACNAGNPGCQMAQALLDWLAKPGTATIEDAPASAV